MADEIELAALRLFAEHGIDGVSVDDIADAADISRRTFFRYFSSKDDLLHGHPERQLETVRAALESAPRKTKPAALARTVLLALTAEFAGRREVLLLRKRIATKSPDAFTQAGGRHSAVVEDIVAALATRMGVDPDTDLRPRVYVYSGFGAVQAAARGWLATGARGSLEDRTAQAFDLIGLK